MKFKFVLLTIVLFIVILSVAAQVKPPIAILPIPTPAQLQWQKMEAYAFVHFGLNTFNDLEWGYGNTPAEIFNPTDLNCDQWVSIIKAAGLKGIILTAKHHDGFCLWQTKTTDYSVKSSPWKNGKGDMVRDLSEACKRYGLKFGIYLSPWDRNSVHYGKEEYVKIYHEQIRELTSNYGPLFEYWFDGANGGNGWYGGADEIRSIDASVYYNYKKACEIITEKHPNIMIFGGSYPTIRWVGNEEGWAGQTNWSTMDINKKVHYKQSQWGMEDGAEWQPAECDVSIRPGWFYHQREDHQVRSVDNLVNLYYESVGRNATLLLNFPIALSGRIHPVDSARILEWHAVMQEEFKINLLKDTKVNASSERGPKYTASRVVDGEYESYWATEEGVKAASLTFSLMRPTLMNRLLIQEYIPLGQRVGKFNIEVEQEGKWIAVATTDTMSTIGYKRLIRFATVEASSVRVNFIESKGPLCINNVEAFLAPMLMAEPQITRNEKDEIRIGTNLEGVEILYTTDGSEPTPENSKVYSEPFTFAQKGTIKAITLDRQQNKQSKTNTRDFDIPSSHYKVNNINDSKTTVIFDGNGHSTYYLPKGIHELVVELDSPQMIRGFVYTPTQLRDGQGHIENYEFYVDAKKVVSGEFSNIKHNPIEQRVFFDEIEGKIVTLKVIRIVDNVKYVSIGDFSIVTK